MGKEQKTFPFSRWWPFHCIRWKRLLVGRNDAEGCKVEYSYGAWHWCNLLHVYAVAFDAQEPVLLVGFLEAVDLEDGKELCWCCRRWLINFNILSKYVALPIDANCRWSFDLIKWFEGGWKFSCNSLDVCGAETIPGTFVFPESHRSFTEIWIISQMSGKQSKNTSNINFTPSQRGVWFSWSRQLWWDWVKSINCKIHSVRLQGSCKTPNSTAYSGRLPSSFAWCGPGKPVT